MYIYIYTLMCVCVPVCVCVCTAMGEFFNLLSLLPLFKSGEVNKISGDSCLPAFLYIWKLPFLALNIQSL